MIDTNLYANPVALQRDAHRTLCWAGDVPDFARTATTAALFLTVVELPDACLDFPVVFVYAGKGPDGQDEVAPMAVVGLNPGENLMLDDKHQWLAKYVPVTLRTYPLAIAREQDDAYTLCIDPASPRLSTDQGKRLFNDDGSSTEFLEQMREYLEKVELEVERTRITGRRLLEMGLLQPMRFDATLPDGQTLALERFLAIDEKKLGELPETVLADFTKSGLMKIIQAQTISMAHMPRLVERHVQRHGKV